MLRRAVTEEQTRQYVENVLAVELTPDMDGQALTGVFVDDGEHAERLAIVGPVHHEVVGPHVIATRWA